MLLGNVGDAIASLEEARDRDPSDDEARVWLGEALARSGRYTEAMVEFERVAQRTDPSPWALIGRAIVRAHTGDHDGILADWARLSGPEVALFQSVLDRERPGFFDHAVPSLERLREGALGVRRPERWLRPLWIGRTEWQLPDAEPDVLSGSRRQERPLRTPLGLDVGEVVSVPGVGDASVAGFRHRDEHVCELTLSRDGLPPLVVIVSAVEPPAYFCRTGKGFFVWYEGDPGDPGLAVVTALAARL